MKLSTYAIINVILAAGFGLFFIFMPDRAATFYGVAACASGIWVTRYFGAALLFFAMIFWSYSSVTPAAKSWPKLLQFGIIYDAIQLVLTIMAIRSGVGNTNSWSSVAIYALLIIGNFYYLGVCKKAREKASA